MKEEIKKNPFPNFLGKIERGTLEDAIDIVEVTEKMDGSYFQFGWYKGEFRYRTKNTLDHEGIDKMFNKVIEYIISYQDGFNKEIVYCCEYFKGKRHNKLNYENFPNEWMLFIISEFDWLKNEEINISPKSRLDNHKTIIQYAPLENFKNYDDLNGMSQSRFGKIREGVVIKNSKGERFKYVTDYFKEVAHKKIVKDPKLVDDLFIPYIEGIKARTDKSIFRLKEKGIEASKKDFGRIIGETVKDLLEEERENIKEEIYKFYDKKFKSQVTKKIIEYLFEVLK